MTVRSALYRLPDLELPLDSHPESRLDFAQVRRAVQDGYDRPLLLIDTDIVRAKARRMRAAMPRVQAHYAVKANPHPEVLRTLIEEGVGFEVASIAELDLLIGLGVDPTGVHYSNPVKSPAYIRYAAGKGLRWYAVDSEAELRKIFSIDPRARMCLRIDVPNAGSDWPLSGKFGAQPKEADEIVAAAATLGADLAGVTFHVGSQCRSAENWYMAIETARLTLRKMQRAGLTPRVLNIGGGFPVRLTKPIPSIEVIGNVVNHALEQIPADLQVIAEPGRYLVSDAGWLVCRVVGTAVRGGKRWLYLDAGMFGGLLETSDGLLYDVITDRSGPLVPWHVAGPTCDSVDVVMRDHLLPEDLQADDFIYLPNAAAYTTAYASNFNGFPLPEVRFVAH
jgi:ornithine decarboxylase